MRASSSNGSLSRRVVLVERDDAGAHVLEHALASRGWGVTRLASGRAYAPWEDPDVLLLVLDDDDGDIFEILVRLASLEQRPSIVVLTRRAHTRALGGSVRASLGIDEVVAWPCRVDQLTYALERAVASHEPARYVS